MIEYEAIWVSLKLALISTLILLVIALPLGWWLAATRSKFKALIEAAVAMPLVLPPTVLGFYMLLALGPDGWIADLTGESLAFTFEGLVLGSILYSLPFVVQPIQASMAGIKSSVLESAAVLGASRLDRFFSIVLPLSSPGLVAAAVLGFAHTLGEFGVVLMIGGSIPGETRVISVVIFEQVEQLNYGAAHTLSAILLVTSFVLLFSVYWKGTKLRVWSR